jgi:ParB-like chromosome segregation protein Spo0J
LAKSATRILFGYTTRQRACAREGDASVNLADKLTVEQWPIDRLIEYARNPRKNDAVVDQMAGAIREFGFRIPIVAKSDGSVVDGHLRLKAARKLGLTEVPVALADELTDAQIKAFRLLVNRSANWSEWDTELLRLELGDLNVLGFDLTLTGFGEIELGSLLADKTEGLTDPDDAPVANAALFLASDEANFITGVALPVDGGALVRVG